MASGIVYGSRRSNTVANHAESGLYLMSGYDQMVPVFPVEIVSANWGLLRTKSCIWLKLPDDCNEPIRRLYDGKGQDQGSITHFVLLQHCFRGHI